MTRYRPHACAFVLIAMASAEPTASAATASANVQAQIVAEHESIRGREPFWVGLQLRMAPEWHTYWKNPGDAGLPTRIRWQLPPGFTAGGIEWPYPARFGASPVVSYGYADEVLLLVRVTPPATLAPGSVTLAARAD